MDSNCKGGYAQRGRAPFDFVLLDFSWLNGPVTAMKCPILSASTMQRTALFRLSDPVRPPLSPTNARSNSSGLPERHQEALWRSTASVVANDAISAKHFLVPSSSFALGWAQSVAVDGDAMRALQGCKSEVMRAVERLGSSRFTKVDELREARAYLQALDQANPAAMHHALLIAPDLVVWQHGYGIRGVGAVAAANASPDRQRIGQSVGTWTVHERTHSFWLPHAAARHDGALRFLTRTPAALARLQQPALLGATARALANPTVLPGFTLLSGTTAKEQGEQNSAGLFSRIGDIAGQAPDIFRRYRLSESLNDLWHWAHVCNQTSALTPEVRRRQAAGDASDDVELFCRFGTFAHTQQSASLTFDRSSQSLPSIHLELLPVASE